MATPPPRATIKDVAAEAGVSVAAVSKVLRSAYGVSDQMRERVTTAIDKLNYRPRAGARAMRGHSYSIGVILVDFSSPFQFEIAQAIADELENTDYHDLIVNGRLDPDRYAKRLEELIDLQVDGLILVAPRLDEKLLARFSRTLPIVTIALHGAASSFDTVVTDEALGARLMIDHLAGLGHERIAHITMPSTTTEQNFKLSHTARLQGYTDAMEAHGLTPDVITTAYSESGGFDAVHRVTKRKHPPTAIFAGADSAAFGALRAADELGLHVPDDLSITGYDNVHTAGLSRVSLTTIDESGIQTGQIAIRLLLERIDGRKDSVHEVITPRLVARSTSGPARS
ncbi:LacI family DNA-binding transcriptional regulator [Schaalia vaccimaxillae]|uniref:LacI family DNA-binding transcriptional regulator n=1 Tax=Schaalia vaccimaxillae TaxID=183916 RepID=UPI0003B64931|nr:LacI family DNA-binding transcriptional regulator [Schaalia vaccimaxillae]